jgi:hypothetical protein
LPRAKRIEEIRAILPKITTKTTTVTEATETAGITTKTTTATEATETAGITTKTTTATEAMAETTTRITAMALLVHQRRRRRALLVHQRR